MGCLAASDPGFGKTEISRLAIPGAHDAGTFDLDPTLFDKASGSDCTNYSPVFSQGLGDLVKAWSMTQDLDFTHQLDAGIRYLDIRIAYSGSSSLGWRIVHTEFSRRALSEDLDSIAAWAKDHPTELVIVDVQHLCYDNSPTAAADLQLWQDFAALGPLSYVAPSGMSVTSVTPDEVVSSRRNVIVMLPDYALQTNALSNIDHVHATFVIAPATGPARTAPSPRLPEAYAWPSTIAPASAAAFSGANRALEAFPIAYSPPLGSLQGKGFFQSQLIYSLSSNLTSDLPLLSAFGGLIPAKGSTKPAWESGLWSATYSRNDALKAWGPKLNVVVSDGIEYGGYVPAVVEEDAS